MNQKSKTMETLFEKNIALLNEIKRIKNDIVMLKSRTNTCQNPGYMQEDTGDMMVYKPLNEYEDESLETMEGLSNRRHSTEELLGLEFTSYTSRDLPGQGLPPGKWVEVTAEMVVSNFFLINICFIENSENSRDSVRSLNWSVKDNLQQFELDSLRPIIQNDLPRLLCRLKEYARLNLDRTTVLGKFSDKFSKHLKIHSIESGMLVRWIGGGLFKIIWSLQYSPDTDCIENNLIIEVNDKERVFMKISRGILEELINGRQTVEERQNSLIELGKRAVQYCEEISDF